MGRGATEHDDGVSPSPTAAMRDAFNVSAPAILDQLIDLLPLALVIIDRAGTIRAFNHQAEKTFGYTAAELLGENVKILAPPYVADHHDTYLENYARTKEKRIIGSNRVEMARHRAGHQFPVELNISEIDLGGQVGFVSFLRPLSKEDLNETEPRVMLADLARASRISAMGALATTIAHELNQPLTNIANYTKGLCNLVERQDDFEGKEEAIRVLNLCSNQAVRAGQLIHRLRDFIKGGQPQSEEYALADIIREATALAMIDGYKRTLHVTYNIPANLPLVKVDQLQGQQVIFNLLRNAIEAIDTEDGGQHEIIISARQLGTDEVELSIEDEGPGIDPIIADSLFDSFVTTKGGGMGVGLAICKQIIAANGGDIRAGQSERLGGAAFHLTLPIARNTPAAED